MNILNAAERRKEMNQPSLDGLYQQVRKLDTSPKVQHFLWRCLSNSLPVADNMRNHHMSREGSCGRCAMADETVNHLLFKCPYARLVCAISPIHAPFGGEMSDSLYSNLHLLMNLNYEYPKEEAHDLLVPWLLWRIWKNKNEFLFKGKDYNALSTVKKTREDMEEWKSQQ